MQASTGFYLIDKLLELLPRSPFADFVAQFAQLPALGYLNWFFPVRGALTVLAAWLGAISLYYVYSVIMRWVKLIGD